MVLSWSPKDVCQILSWPARVVIRNADNCSSVVKISLILCLNVFYLTVFNLPFLTSCYVYNINEPRWANHDIHVLKASQTYRDHIMSHTLLQVVGSEQNTDVSKANSVSSHIWLTKLRIVGEDRGAPMERFFSLTVSYTIPLALTRAVFDRLKIIIHYLWNIFPKRCYRLFIKTIKNNINLCKMGIMTPLIK